MVCLLCDFKILLTVFNQSYNCQSSHYLGRNWLLKPFLILPSLTRDTSPRNLCIMTLTNIEENKKYGQYLNISKNNLNLIDRKLKNIDKCSRSLYVWIDFNGQSLIKIGDIPFPKLTMNLDFSMNRSCIDKMRLLQLFRFFKLLT